MRYVAVLETDPNVRAGTSESLRPFFNDLRHQKHWSSQAITNDLCVYVRQPENRKSDFRQLKSNNVMALGLLFCKTASEVDPLASSEDINFDGIDNSPGDWLFDKFWGEYVVFGHNTRSDSYFAVRDPTGSVPCYRITVGSTLVFFSHLEDVWEVLPCKKVSTARLASHLVNPIPAKQGTTLEGVNQVHPGETLHIDGKAETSEYCWNPYRFTKIGSAKSIEEYAFGLRNILTKAVRTLASQYNDVLVPIGGLDSSTIVSCLMSAKNRPNVKLLTYSTHGPAGDEFHYTKSVCDFFDLPVDRYFLNAGNVSFDNVAEVNPAPIPSRVLEFGDEAAQPPLSRYGNSQAVFTGVGGDTLLCQSPGLLPFIDSIRAGRSIRRNVKTLAHTVRSSQRSAWQVLSGAIEALQLNPEANSSLDIVMNGLSNSPWYSSEAMDISKDFLHPGLLASEGITEGKVFQTVLNCFLPVNTTGRLHHFGKLPYHHPFVSQPVVEACLAIPLWILNLWGFDRGLLRYAFRAGLPDPMLMRFTKGTPAEVYDAFVQQNLEAIRERIRFGFSWRNGLFSEAWKDKVSSSEGILGIPGFVLLHALNIELWYESVEQKF